MIILSERERESIYAVYIYSKSCVLSSDSDSDNKPNRPTIYFVPQDGVQQPDFPPGLRHITVSQSDESEKMGQFSDDDEFCIIDDPGLGISVTNPTNLSSVRQYLPVYFVCALAMAILVQITLA